MKNMMDISIVLPTLNRSKELHQCILSLKKQNSCNFEIIVVDDGSLDSTSEMIESEFPDIRLIRNEINFGPGYSRNVGIIEAISDYVLFLDSDTELMHSSVLSNFLKFFQTHQKTGSLGGEIRNYKVKNDTVFGRLVVGDGDSKPVSVKNEIGNYQECDFLATCCCMVKKEIAIKIGGFDPYYGFGGEDKDFGWRIKQAGYKNYVSADCAAIHHHSPSGRSFDETFKYHKTRMRFVFILVLSFRGFTAYSLNKYSKPCSLYI